MPAALLSAEIASLVHHVELHKSGWWDSGIERFIMAAIWLNGRSLNDKEIVQELRNRFFLNTDTARIKKHTDILCADGTLVCLSGGSYKISERAAREFEKT